MVSAPILHKHQPRLVPQERLKEYMCYRQVFICYPRLNQSRFYDTFGPFSPKITIVRSKCFFKLTEQQAWHIKKSTIYVNLGIGHFQKYHSHQNQTVISYKKMYFKKFGHFGYMNVDTFEEKTSTFFHVYLTFHLIRSFIEVTLELQKYTESSQL